ncbi:hypothetical protein ACHAXR_010587 [Thalassiosira sp. AJA248-18]
MARVLWSHAKFHQQFHRSLSSPTLRANTPVITFINHYHRSATSSNDEVIYNDPRRKSVLPGIQRIVLIRHGESLGNIDERAYVTTADWRIPLTKLGREQARQAGKKVDKLLADGGRDGKSDEKGKVFFYVSPYLRARQSLREILREVDPECIVGIREDPRIAEQQFGNFQTHQHIQDNKATRTDFGRFFYRFPDGGESGFDVYNRVSGFIGTLQRDSNQVLEMTNEPHDSVWPLSDNCPSSLEEGMTVCIVTHGLAMRLLLMRYLQYSVHEFERSHNPKNGRVVVLEYQEPGRFEMSELDRIAMGFPLYSEQERFRLMHDYSLLDKSDW